MGDIIKDLNPQKVDFSKKYKIIELFNPVKKYFAEVKKKEISIADIIENLNNEKSILDRDNITLEIEIKRLNEIIVQLQNEYDYGNVLKSDLESLVQISKNNKDEMKVNYYTKNFLTQVDKRMFDIRQMIIVKQQNIIALQIIIRNNKEIMRNIERINNITINALNTAVLVAKSLYNQKIILKKINNIEYNIGKVTTNIGTELKELEIDRIDTVSDAQLLLEKTFDNAISVLGEVDVQNKKDFPENEKKIIELKMGE